MSWRDGVSRGHGITYHGKGRRHREKSADFPDPKLLKLLECRANTHGGSFMFLLDYGELRYLYRLTYNKKVSDCVENKLLRGIHDAIEIKEATRDRDVLHDEAIKCLRVLWPFLKADYEAQLGKSNAKLRDEGSGPRPVRNIQVRTNADGKLEAYEHTVRLVLHETLPISNIYSHLKLFGRDEIVKSEQLSEFVFKVRIKEAKYVLKELPLGLFLELYEMVFKRELELLQKIPSHPNLISLAGLRDAGEGKIDGILLPYIDGRSLKSVNVATSSQKEKWKKQIADAIRVLHETDIVWGDAKPENIVIEEERDKAVLVDFGGGTTRGWVDHKLAETKEGDLQGLDRILEYIENL